MIVVLEIMFITLKTYFREGSTMFSRDYELLVEENSKRMPTIDDDRTIKECLKEEQVYIELIQYI